MNAIKWNNNELIILDQRKLPLTTSYIKCKSYKTVIDAIYTLSVRGAPLIGIAAAYGMVLAAIESQKLPKSGQKDFIINAGNKLKNTRPTAVNLSLVINKILKLTEKSDLKNIINILLKEATDIDKEDQILCDEIANNGIELFKNKTNLKILTHCNTGSLATQGIGTALGIIKKLNLNKQIKCIYIDETRPLLQGSRLTAYELNNEKVPCKLITDSTAAFILKKEKIDAVIVGADRIASNGDTANKIGTYGLAIAAKFHNIPFYIAAPSSTFDFNLKNGNQIIIEERDSKEIKEYNNKEISPKEIDVYNPAFDVTDNTLITGFITEKEILYPPYDISFSKLK